MDVCGALSAYEDGDVGERAQVERPCRCSLVVRCVRVWIAQACVGQVANEAGKGAKEAGKGAKEAGMGANEAGLGAKEAGKGAKEAGMGANEAGKGTN